MPAGRVLVFASSRLSFNRVAVWRVLVGWWLQRFHVPVRCLLPISRVQVLAGGAPGLTGAE